MTAEQDAVAYFYENVGLGVVPDSHRYTNAYFFENVGWEGEAVYSRHANVYFYENVEFYGGLRILVPRSRLMHYPGGDFEPSMLRRWTGSAYVPVALRRYTGNWQVTSSQIFEYTGAYQTFVVPDGVTLLAVDAYGAQGGNEYSALSTSKGARVRCDVSVTPGETLRVYVGGFPGTAETGGFNGGATTSGTNAGGGGGASDIRRSPYALADRLVVAGGGGGKGANGGGQGGNGGSIGLVGTAGTPGTILGGGGGTASAGGVAGTGGGGTTPSAGTLGDGGNGGGTSPRGGGGGGGGYYGGGGGAGGTSAGQAGAGGGGGSSLSTGINELVETGVRSSHGRVFLTWPQLGWVRVHTGWAGSIYAIPTPNLIGWWQADALELDNGDPVTSWVDTYSSKNLTAGVAAEYVTNIINGLPAVRFDGSKLSVSFGSTKTQPNTIFIVCSQELTSYRYVFEGDGASSRHGFGRINGGDTMDLYAGTLVVGAGQAVPTGVHLWTTLFNGGSSYVRKDGVQVSTGNVGSQSPGGFTLGSKYDGLDSMVGYVAEVLFFNAELSGTDRDAVETYLMNKYGL